MEQELMGLYKLGENRFDLDRWNASTDKRFWHIDQENANSRLLDLLAFEIRRSNRVGGYTLQHAWELALRTRRERVFISDRIQKKISALLDSGRDQKFATENQGTGCWDVFYFNHGVDTDCFRREAQQMADRKMWVERIQNDFKQSVFCFALRSSPISGERIVEVVLTVSDSWKWPDVSPDKLAEACRYFGQIETRPIREFPGI